MSSLLHFVAHLAGSSRPSATGLTAALTEALAAEPRLSISTRLGLVALASRIEAGEAGGLELPVDCLSEALRAAEEGDDARTLEALIACTPALRAAAIALAQRNDPFALVPQALLQLIASRLH
ncbi:MAG: hypothetical protein J0H00_05330 [Burkholderiales bacterium]|nr:hypothetical protein [Burkholderiales bacterium]OJX00897.1 MAG: hypothetical protein BGO72_05890 [Burkholderiales bacterium 70-64]